MSIGNIALKSVLLSKTTGLKRGLSFFTEDITKFINKNGENCIFTEFRNEKSQVVRKLLVNNTTGFTKDRRYIYKTYTFKNGESVPYREIITRKSDGAYTREIISTIQNGNNTDVTKSMFSQKLNQNGNKIEKSIVARFSKGKKPMGVVSKVEKTPNEDIISQKTNVFKANGRKMKIVPDMFYRFATFDDVNYKREIIKTLKSEMGLNNKGILVKPAHRGYVKGGLNNYAKYQDKIKTVTINVDVPIVNGRKQFASEVSHELFHAWQHSEVELLEQGLLKGARKEAAEIYRNEFLNSISASKNYEKYRAQVVETGARNFQKFVEKYYSQNMKNIYNVYAKGIIPPQIGITAPLPVGELKKMI